MSDLFHVRALTTAVNSIQSPSMVVYNRVFRGREKFQNTDRLQFDVLTGSETVLPNLSAIAPAHVSDKAGRKTVTLTAPRLAHKRFISAAELNAAREAGGIGPALMEDRVARELTDMKNAIDRTMEFWAAGALKGKIYDADLETVLVDYGVESKHKPTLSGTDKFTDAASKPLARIRAWQTLIEQDAGAVMTGWVAFVGSAVMDALMVHSDVIDLLKYTRGEAVANAGRISRLSEIELVEYNASFLKGGTRKRFIEANEFVLVGLCEDVVSVEYAPVVDTEAPGGVGNVDENNQPQVFFSKSWAEKDPSGRWIKVEARPVPVLQRPGAVVAAKAV
jgi:hypothetical protein